MIGERASTGTSVDALIDRVASCESRLGDLARARPAEIVQRGFTAGPTNASGDVTVTFLAPFSVPPTIIVSNASNTLAQVPSATATTTGATIRVRDFAGAVVASGAVAVNWQATGARA